MSTSLIFSAAPLTGLPVHLVFGDEPTAEIPVGSPGTELEFAL